MKYLSEFTAALGLFMAGFCTAMASITAAGPEEAWRIFDGPLGHEGMTVLWIAVGILAMAGSRLIISGLSIEPHWTTELDYERRKMEERRHATKN